jgi:hypothetical protein
MPTGPVPTTGRGGGWAAKRSVAPFTATPGANGSLVYGADTHFGEMLGDKDAVGTSWSQIPLSDVQTDPRNATRRVVPDNSKCDKPAVGQIDDNVDRRFVLYDMSRDEVDTVGVLINGPNGPEPRRLMRMLPSHHINAMGELSGYRFSAAPGDSCSALPINRKMFHGTSAVQCMASTKSIRGGCSTNSDVTRLTADMDVCVATMKQLMLDISKDANEAVIARSTACFDCSPCNTDAVVAQGSVGVRSHPTWGCPLSHEAFV